MLVEYSWMIRELQKIIKDIQNIEDPYEKRKFMEIYRLI